MIWNGCNFIHFSHRIEYFHNRTKPKHVLDDAVGFRDDTVSWRTVCGQLAPSWTFIFGARTFQSRSNMISNKPLYPQYTYIYKRAQQFDYTSVWYDCGKGRRMIWLILCDTWFYITWVITTCQKICWHLHTDTCNPFMSSYTAHTHIHTHTHPSQWYQGRWRAIIIGST